MGANGYLLLWLSPKEPGRKSLRWQGASPFSTGLPGPAWREHFCGGWPARATSLAGWHIPVSTSFSMSRPGSGVRLTSLRFPGRGPGFDQRRVPGAEASQIRALYCICPSAPTRPQRGDFNPAQGAAWEAPMRTHTPALNGRDNPASPVQLVPWAHFRGHSRFPFASGKPGKNSAPGKAVPRAPGRRKRSVPQAGLCASANWSAPPAADYLRCWFPKARLVPGKIRTVFYRPGSTPMAGLAKLAGHVGRRSAAPPALWPPGSGWLRRRPSPAKAGPAPARPRLCRKGLPLGQVRGRLGACSTTRPENSKS